MILAGDIGGTKTILAVFSDEKGMNVPVAEQTFPSADYTSLEVMIHEFLSMTGMSVDVACFGVAGPIVNQQVKITNLSWSINAARVRDTLKLKAVYLLNDLEAIANAVPVLNRSDLHTLNDRAARPGGCIGVLAAGTGLGEAFLTWDGSRYHAYASEGGHGSFAPRNATELDMLRYLLERYDHVSYERVCSGIGLPNIYAYYRDSRYAEELPQVARLLDTVADPTPVIVTSAMDAENPSPLCRRALETFVAALGSESGNLALKLLASGGIYLGGGIPPRILPLLESGLFMQSFKDKGRFADMLDQMPVHIILNPRAGLIGAAHVAFVGV